MKKIFILLLLLAFYFHTTAQTATFNITYTGGTPQIQASFQYAARIWGNIVSSSVPIKVLVHYTPLSSGTLGITFPNGRLNYNGAPYQNYWYSTSLANSITGVELNPGEVDIEIYLNSTANWYFDSVGTVPAGKYDFITVAIHEIAHGLNFLSLAKKTGTTGSLGTLTSSDFFPLTTSYPWPNLDTLPSIFDKYIVTFSNQKVDSFANPSSALGTILTNNNLYFNGPNAVAVNNGVRPRIYAPAVFALGSSITHLNEGAYPAGNPNEMMTPFAPPAYRNHNPGPICIGILKDIGWTINPYIGINETDKNQYFSIYPNPANNQLFINAAMSSEKIKTIEVKNMLGETVISSENAAFIDVSQLQKGVYIILLNHEYLSSQKFIKQ